MLVRMKGCLLTGRRCGVDGPRSSASLKVVVRVRGPRQMHREVALGDEARCAASTDVRKDLTDR
eukprot:29962-Eustigmatos_ZCMA.PRE.1